MAADTGFSERHTRLRRAAGFLVVAGVFACGAALVAPQAYEGEYGLWIELSGDSMVAHWLSDDSVPGEAMLVTGSDSRHVTTPAGLSHSASFGVVAGTPFDLRYGTASALHDTHIVPDFSREPVSLPEVDSLFIVGDTHGDVAALLSGLGAAGLVDSAGHWTGGRKHLVFAGDLMDRGPEATRLFWLVRRLVREAAEAGGGVHVVLGNHEIMVMLGDLRYVNPRELEIARRHGVTYQHLFDPRESLLGRWLATRPAVLRIGRVLITHGGIAPETARLPLEAFDDTLARYTGEDLFYRWADSTYMPPLDSAAYEARLDFFWGPRSVFWHRDYVLTDTVGAELDQVLHAWDADLLVVGHTAVPQIQARYDGRLIAAHTRRFGAELLLLVRGPDGLQRVRISAGRPPEPF